MTTLSHEDGRALVLEVNRAIVQMPKSVQAKLENVALEHEGEVHIGISAPAA